MMQSENASGLKQYLPKHIPGYRTDIVNKTEDSCVQVAYHLT